MAAIRVIQTTTNAFGPFNQTGPTQVDESVFWTGDSAEELSRAFSPSEIFGADPLGHAEIEDGLIRFDFRFEQGYGDEWEEIPDPRVRLNSRLSAAERAQNAENRRLYPGDFYGTPCLNCHSPSCLGGCYVETCEDDELYEHLGWCVYCKESFCEGECQDEEEFLDPTYSP